MSHDAKPLVRVNVWRLSRIACVITSARHRVGLRLLRYVLVVADELHMGRAAERLHMTQQPLSVVIRRLEDAIGAELVVRKRIGFS